LIKVLSTTVFYVIKNYSRVQTFIRVKTYSNYGINTLLKIEQCKTKNKSTKCHVHRQITKMKIFEIIW